MNTSTSARTVRRFVDPDDLIRPGCGDQVIGPARVLAGARRAVGPGVLAPGPVGAVPHVGRAGCRAGRGDPVTAPAVVSPVVDADVSTAGGVSGPISAPMVAALEAAAAVGFRDFETSEEKWQLRTGDRQRSRLPGSGT
jgi:hypothetical protein